jgi:hypothetical protein
MKKIICSFGLFPMVALAQTSPEEAGFFERLLESVTNGNVWILMSCVVGLMIWVAQKFLSNRLPWLGTPMATTIMAVVLAFSGALATALPVGGFGALTVPVLVAAVKITFSSAAGKLMLQLLLAWILSKIGVPTIDAQAVKVEAIKSGEEAASNVEPLTSKDIGNKQ